MHIAAAEQVVHHLIPALRPAARALAAKPNAFADIIKIGRTHLQDATPLTLGQEFSGYASSSRTASLPSKRPAPRLRARARRHRRRHRPQLPQGLRRAAPHIATLTGLPFVTAPNKFEALAGARRLVEPHGALKTLACSADEDRQRHPLAGSGPRCGLGELAARERARLLDHARQGQPDPVRGHDDGLRAGDRQPRRRRHRRRHGHFELNVFKPF
jgi:fumarate hydratase class II